MKEKTETILERVERIKRELAKALPVPPDDAPPPPKPKTETDKETEP